MFIVPSEMTSFFIILFLVGNCEAIAIGEGVRVPMRLRFDALPEAERPRSNAARFSERWTATGDDDQDELAKLVATLRGRR